ncbi:MAG TPA: GH92 family glycosyl hydrolase, partial [Bacteroidales bacterium]|nr:GH92 family glycosyl hydrolase [Bacteroidales bacterium]
NSLLRVYPQREDFTGDLLHGLPLIVTSHRGRSAFNLSPYQGDEKNIKRVIRYSYDQENIKPYSYSVFLDEQKTEVKMAPSHQSGLYELKFGLPGAKYLIINSGDGKMKWDGKTVSGFQSIGNDTKVFICLETEVAPESVSTLKEGKLASLALNSNENACVILKFGEKNTTLKLRYGISFINEEQALNNLKREIKDYDVNALANAGRKVWNESLRKIKVQGGTDDDKAVFYTSLYRTFERPVCVSEDEKYYSAFDGKVHNDNGNPFYTDDWIWDTYRAAHPLRILIDPAKEVDILKSFVTMADQMPKPWMPTFPEITGDSRRMNSNHGVATVLDAHVKGLNGFDLNKAYLACKGAITEKTLAPWSGAPAGELDKFYHTRGYFPALNPNEKETAPEVHSFERRQPVAVTLGTSYDEWCLAQIAKALNKTDDYNQFLKASYNYRNIYNSETNFFHPKNKEGKFIQPFDYILSGGIGGREYYDENNGWTYRWDVQHNVGDLVNLMGGRDNFVKNLDSMFSRPLGQSKFGFYSQFPDQTGNVGQFTMANEPSLHIPYLYNYAGQPWKTQKRIRTLVNEWFRNDLMGVPGDEDGGGMSAFVVFSKIGFYPVTPGSPTYNIGSPVFESSEVQLDNGKVFKVIAKNCSEENKYIQSATLNGKEWNKPWFSHSDIKDGGVLELVMGPVANTSWGSSPDAVPPSAEKIAQ